MVNEYSVNESDKDCDESYVQPDASGPFIPLSMIREGEKVRVIHVDGKDEMRRFLSSLGLVENAEIAIISEQKGNMIIHVKGTRLAISKAMASCVLTA